MTNRAHHAQAHSDSPARIGKIIAVILCAFAVTLPAPAELEAQVRRGRQTAETGPWAPIRAGVRVGYNQNPTGETLGLGVHIPVLRSGAIEFAPSVDWVFIRGTRDRQISLDAYFVRGGRGGGFFVGGGPAWRHTNNAAPGVPAQTLNGYSLVAGLQSAAGGLLQTQAEIRYIILPDSSFNPTAISISLVLPLWRNPPQS